MLRATTEQQERLLVLELEAQLLNAVVELENLLELRGNLGQAVHDVVAPLVLAGTVLGQREREHDHADELRGVGLGGGNTDLGARVDVDTAVGHEGDGGTDDVDDTHGQGATLEAVAESHEGVGRLTGLGDEDAGVVAEDGSLTVEEVGSQLDGDGDLGQLLKATTDSHAGVVRGTASDEDQTPAAPDGADVLPQTTKRYSPVLGVQATTHGVDDGLGLLENLLLHEVVEAALHDLLQLNLQSLNSADIASAIGLAKTVDVELSLVDVGNVVVLEVENLLGVLDDSRWVGGEEELGWLRRTVVGEESAGLRAVEEGLVRGGKQATTDLVLNHCNVLAGTLGRKCVTQTHIRSWLDVHKVDLHLPLRPHTDDQGRTLAGRDNFMRVVHALDEETESSLQLFDDGLDEGGEVNVRVLVVNVLGELGNGLGVGLSLELEALGLKESLEFLVVGDDTVVDDGKLPVGVRPAREVRSQYPELSSPPRC